MSGLFVQVSNFAINLVDEMGYGGVFFLSIFDKVGINLVPAEIVLPLFGFLVSKSGFSFSLVLLISVLGHLVGELFLYLIALKGGRLFLDKYGKYVFVSRHEINHIEELFKKYGAMLVIFGRFLPVAGSLISIPAGIARMNLKKFCIYTLVGSFPRNFIYIFIGFKAGENWNKVASYLDRFDLPILIFGSGLFIWYIYRHLRRRHFSH